MTNWIYVLTGIYLMAMGLTAKSAPGVPGVEQTADEARARSAPAKRVTVVALGLLTLVYGVYQLGRLHAAAV